MQISALANWGKPKTGDDGERFGLCRVATPTPIFWAYWRTFKEEIFDAQVTMKRVGAGKAWVLFWWSHDGEKFLDPNLTKAAGPRGAAAVPSQYAGSLEPTPPIPETDSERLLPYQRAHAAALVSALHRYRGALDASDTGTGKTYAALVAVKTLGLEPFVVCPKSIIRKWHQVGEELRAPVGGVINYEKLRTGNTAFGSWNAEGKFVWDFEPSDKMVIIFDEIHRAKGRKTSNAEMVLAAKKQNLVVLGLSATAASNPLEMKALGRVLDLYPPRGYSKWVKSNGVIIEGGTYVFRQSNLLLAKLHREIFPKKGSRIRIADLGSAFPETQITAESYDLGERAQGEFIKAYSEMLSTLEDEELTAANALVARLKARQKTELLKAPVLIDLANDLVSEGHSVVIFTSFVATAQALWERLNKPCLVIGGQTEKERQENIEDFQKDKTHVLVANIAAGGESIDLHDIRGERSRVALICPTDSAIQLRQALGRVHRAGSKSKSLQRIVFAAGTIEEEICKNVRRKLNNISLINDGDLSLLPPL